MKITDNTKVFLAFLAVMFALQAVFDGRSILNAVTSDALETFLQRLAVSTRASNFRLRVLPTRSNSRCCKTRSSLACRGGGSSPISSRKTVPPSATSSLPFLVAIAPVKAPFSCPNNSLSRVGVVGGFLFKPGHDGGRGGEVLIVGNRFGNQRGIIKLLAPRFEFAAVLVPGPPPAPGLFAMKQGDQCHKPSQQDQDAPQPPPTEEPAAEVHRCAAFNHRGFVRCVHRIVQFEVSGSGSDANQADAMENGWTWLRGDGMGFCGAGAASATGAPISSRSCRWFSRSAASSCRGDGASRWASPCVGAGAWSSLSAITASHAALSPARCQRRDHRNWRQPASSAEARLGATDGMRVARTGASGARSATTFSRMASSLGSAA